MFATLAVSHVDRAPNRLEHQEIRPHRPPIPQILLEKADRWRPSGNVSGIANTKLPPRLRADDYTLETVDPSHFILDEQPDLVRARPIALPR